MKLFVEFEGNETMTNIGFAKAIIDTDCFRASDLQEVGNYLILYSDARAKEGLERLRDGESQCKGGAE